MADDVATGTVVVALPATDDPVQGIGDEPKHATLVFLGDDIDAAHVDAVHRAVANYVAEGLADGTNGPFTEKVTGVESLGDKSARVWMIASDDGLTALHDELAALPAIAKLMAKVEQFPSYTPHVTIGYPADGEADLGKAIETDAEGIESISFDRIALWSGPAQTQFPLNEGGTVTAATAERLVVHETATLSERATQGHAGRWQVQAISAGLGSSGYYSPDVIEHAARNELISEGTPLFFDHPSKSDASDRPERSVRDIAAVFTSPAVYDADLQALVGEVQVFGPYRDLVSEMAPFIGLSIWGSATDITEGTVGGRKVPVVEDLHAINSVDLVTKAGRGGQFMSLLESARAETDRQAEQAGAPVGEATYSDKQTALCDAVRSEYGGEKTYAWVRDFDDETVWFEVSADGGSDDALYGQGYSFDAASGQASLTGSRTEVRAVTTYQPVGTSSASENAAQEAAMTQENSGGAAAESTGAATETTTTATEAAAAETATGQPAAESTHTPSTPQEAHMTDTTQGAGGTAAPAQEAAQPVSGQAPRNPREVMEAQIREQGHQIALLRAEGRARDVVAEVLVSGWIGDAQRTRLASSLVHDIPLTEAGELDEVTLRDRAQRGLEEAETEAAEILQAAGVGTPRGLGALTTPATEAEGKQYEDELEASFINRGLSESAAKTAVKGR